MLSFPSYRYREKASELWDWVRQLEAEKFELQYRHAKQKYEVRHGITLCRVVLMINHMCPLNKQILGYKPK